MHDRVLGALNGCLPSGSPPLRHSRPDRGRRCVGALISKPRSVRRTVAEAEVRHAERPLTVVTVITTQHCGSCRDAKCSFSIDGDETRSAHTDASRTQRNMFRCNDSPSGNPTPVDASSAPVALSRIPVVLKHCRIDVREAAAVTRLGRSGARPAQRDPDGRGFLDPRIEALQLGGAYRVNPTNRTANRHRPWWDHSARAELVTHVTRVPGGGPGPECSYTAVRNFASNPQNRAKGRPCRCTFPGVCSPSPSPPPPRALTVGAATAASALPHGQDHRRGSANPNLSNGKGLEHAADVYEPIITDYISHCSG